MNNKQKESSTSLFSRIKYIKNIEIYVVVLIAAIMLLVYLGGDLSVSTIKSSNMSEEELRLAYSLSAIKGVGEVRTMITYKDSEKQIPESVIVVSKGAKQPRVVLEIKKACGVAVQVPPYKVEVFEMK